MQCVLMLKMAPWLPLGLARADLFVFFYLLRLIQNSAGAGAMNEKVTVLQEGTSAS